jgi:23S rRNA pseudouridine1911/1915/1917 synthase
MQIPKTPTPPKAQNLQDTFPKELIPRILFEDNHLVVVAKPAGLLTQGEETGSHHLVEWLRNHFGRNYVGLIHRLDRNTSGIMVVAKRTKSARRLTQSLQEGSFKRVYRGWLVGELLAQVRWRHFLVKDTHTNTVSVSTTKTGKESILVGTPIESGIWNQMRLTLAEFELETGRSHQIRVQAAFEGFPLLGDHKYGERSRQFPRVALHSYEVRFPHPMTSNPMYFQDPLPADLRLTSRAAKSNP